MSAAPQLKLASASSTPNPDWSMLVEAGEAARLLGVSDRHLRRIAGSELQGRGLAVHAAPPSGGKARWFIDRRYDARLAPGRVGQTSELPNLEQFTRKQREQAFARRACVQAIREARANRPGNMGDWIGQLAEQLSDKHNIRVSPRSLYRWDRLYRSDADLPKLIDARGGDQKSSGCPQAWKHFRELYLSDSQPTLRDCWRRTKLYASERGIPWCSETACRRQLRRHITAEQELYHREPRAWRQQMQPTIDQDPEAWAAGECYVGDHAQCDFWCRLGKSIIRPWITAWIDWRTRYVVAQLVPSPNSSTIMATLRKAIDDPHTSGGPSAVWIDNGKDYDAYVFHGQTKQQRLKRGYLQSGYINETEFSGLLGLLNIQSHFSIAHNPNGKARMERWFRFVHENFDRDWPAV